MKARIALWGLTLVCLSLTQFASGAGAFVRDARQSAMGGVTMARPEGNPNANVAYRALPHQSGPRIIPMPLGLVQLALAPPVFDTTDPDFSSAEILNLALNPPFDLRLNKVKARTEEPIAVHLAEDQVVIDLGDAVALIPDAGGGRWGDLYSASLVSTGVGQFQVSMAPMLVGEARLSMSTDLREALRNAQPMRSSGDYTVDGDGEMAAAVAIGLTSARQVWGDALEAAADPTRGWRVYTGATFKYLLGIGYAQTTADIDMVPGTPILSPVDPMEVNMVSDIRTSLPGRDGLGQGFAVDAGVLLKRGGDLDVGLGLQNLAGFIQWQTELQRLTFDDSTGETTTETLATAENYKSSLPVTANLSVARRFSDITLASDLRYGPGGPSWHVGAERTLGPYALRGGTSVDSHGNQQFSGGGGVRLGKVGVDMAVYTVNSSLSEDRALMLGGSISLF